MSRVALNRSPSRSSRYGLSLLWIIILAVYLFPVIWMVMTSIRNPVDTYSWPPKFLFQPTLDAFAHLFSGAQGIQKFIRNSLIVAIASTFLTLLLAVPAAYALTLLKIKGRAGVLFGLLVGRIVPPVAVVVPVFLVASQAALIDSHQVLIALYVVFNLPFAIWLMCSFLNDIPGEIREAAVVDGCSELGALLRVILPIAAGGVATTAVFTLIACWNEFLFAVILTNRYATTLPVEVMAFRTQFGVEWGEMGAAALVIVTPVLIFALLMQRYLVRGMTMGAVK
jgi:ABC-type glycerol-3-phosphate transport system permease component